MRAILVLAVIALAVQAQTPVHDFYHSFVSNLHMDASTQNQVLNDGLECLNFALTTVVGAVQNIEHDVAAKDYLTVVREAITSIQTLENEVFPRCLGAYAEIVSYLQHHSNLTYVNSQAKLALFQAKVVQLLGKTVFNAALHGETEQFAHDLAAFVNTAAGLVQEELPYTIEFEYEKYVPLNTEKFVRGFLKGYFTTLGYKNLTQINNTAECVLGLSNNINAFFTNPALHRGDDLAILHAFLNGVQNVTVAWENCKRLDTVDFSLDYKLISLIKEHTAETFFMAFYNNIMNLPTLTQAQINMGVYLIEGEYEIVGQLYAGTVKKTLENILF